MSIEEAEESEGPRGHGETAFYAQALVGGCWDYIAYVKEHQGAEVSAGGFLEVCQQLAERYFSPPDPRYFMAVALFLAHRNVKASSSNPCVGCVYVRHDRIIGGGYTQSFGGLHGERHAAEHFEDKTQLKGCSVYVTLEPCYFEGKQHACADFLGRYEVAKVYVSCLDQDQRIHGQGVKRLREQGVIVDVGLLAAATARFYAVYFRHRQQQSLVVGTKWAQSLDGRLAAPHGHSQWISSSTSLIYSQWLRYVYDGVMVGSQTFITDCPSLSLRHPFFVDKATVGVGVRKVVFDPHLRAWKHSCFGRHYEHMKRHHERVIWITSSEHAQDLEHSASWRLISAEDRAYCLPIFEGSFHQLLRQDQAGRLAAALDGKMSLLVEGGPRLHGLLLGAGVVDVLHMVLCPKWLGGPYGVDPQGCKQPRDINAVSGFRLAAHYGLGEDVLCEYLYSAGDDHRPC